MKLTFLQTTIAIKNRITPSFSLLLSLILAGLSGKASIYTFTSIYNSTQEVPSTGSPGIGIIAGTYDNITKAFSYTIFFTELVGSTTSAELHAPASPGAEGPKIKPHAGFPTGIRTGMYSHIDILTGEQESWLIPGLLYSSIQTAAFPGGEIRAQLILRPLPAGLYPFTAFYLGANENPSNSSAATGIISGTFDDITRTINYTVVFGNLSSGSVAAHFHAPAPLGVNAPVVVPYDGFPSGVAAGIYSHIDFFTTHQRNALLQGLVYSNIQTSLIPAGEIRAQIILGASAPCIAPAILNNGTIVLDASCRSGDGNITIVPLSGTPPLQYSIDGGATYVPGPVGGFTFQNLGVGAYPLRLKDINGCESAVVTKEVRLVYDAPCGGCTPPTFLDNNFIVLDATCGSSDGGIWLVPTSGTAPFQYSLNGGQSYVSGPGTSFGFQNLSAGTYQLRIKDANGCESAVITRSVNSGCERTLSATKSKRIIPNNKQSLFAYPNPTAGMFQVQLFEADFQTVQIQVLDRQGVVVQQRSDNVGDGSTLKFDLTCKAKGLYFIRVVGKFGVHFTKVLFQ